MAETKPHDAVDLAKLEALSGRRGISPRSLVYVLLDEKQIDVETAVELMQQLDDRERPTRLRRLIQSIAS